MSYRLMKGKNRRRLCAGSAEGRACDTPDPGNPRKGTDRADQVATYSGKIEFVSQDLTKAFPDDQERPLWPDIYPAGKDQKAKLRKNILCS